MLRYVHTNLIARDWQVLSHFYQVALGCTPLPDGGRDLAGEWVDKLTGMPGAHIEGEHLALPGYGRQAPTLEIFSYTPAAEAGGEEAPALNAPGYAHIAFLVQDIGGTMQKILDNGGTQMAELVKQRYPGKGLAQFVYMRDPEGNIVELQTWT